MEKGKSTKRSLEERVVLPVIEEELRVEKRPVETGITRISKKVRHFEQEIEEPLVKEQVDVERVAINRFIDQPVGVRTEGEVTIIPVLEEVLVIEKKLRLKEELHIRRRKETITHRQKEVVRKEEAVVEHTDRHH
ncbi:YsnF/AvaK domain-containing protein [Geobacter sp. DSM 9736]|uniref:YsnF/AvaK domain-containing protein n=1 Tax=Geobacter sp. DSM 9736 TaxID=1277350 RepID=UPI000B4FDEC1|nr:YsnF/AvaK domain-containing protein [Geobacter sp. DSM 9736]SNB47172.1 conserved domain-containing protein [Geobacter sp. DSM 9736]